MSITDSSTSLDTAYTEQSLVAFTAGTLADIAACVTEVETKLKRGTLSATTTPTSTQVQNWLIRAKQELAEVKGFSFKRRFAKAATVENQIRYALPPDYNGGHTVLRDTDNDRMIRIWDRHWFDSKYPDPSAETACEPKLACIKGRELIMLPPDGAYTLEIEYERSGEDGTSTDFSWLPELERWRCVDFAVAEAFESLHMFGASDRARRKWEAGVGKAIRADGRRRWKSMRYQAISFIQEAQGMNNQAGN